LSDELGILEKLSADESQVDSELSELLESVSEEDRSQIEDALGKNGDSWSKPGVGKVLKQLKVDLFEDGSLESLVEALSSAKTLLDRQAALSKEVKRRSSELEAQTKRLIESMDISMALELVGTKWIEPLEQGISEAASSKVKQFISEVERIVDKYDETFPDLEGRIKDTESELNSLLAQLVGSDVDMIAIAEYSKMFGGEF
jgi:type I restriction enzyme M protein